MDADRKALYRMHPELAIDDIGRLEELVKQFFSFLDYTESTDDGRPFHPIFVSCCRSMMIEDVNKCLTEMKDFLKIYEKVSIDEQLKFRRCNKCGTLSVQITRQQAKNRAREELEKFEKLDANDKIQYYGSTELKEEEVIKLFEECSNCGNSHYDFSDAPTSIGLDSNTPFTVIIKD